MRNDDTIRKADMKPVDGYPRKTMSMCSHLKRSEKGENIAVNVGGKVVGKTKWSLPNRRWMDNIKDDIQIQGLYEEMIMINKEEMDEQY